MSKPFYKKIDKNPTPIFSCFCYHVFWAFSLGGEFEYAIQKNIAKNA
jgi:hypothetical protein